MRLRFKFAAAALAVLAPTLGLAALASARHQAHMIEQDALERARLLLSLTQGALAYAHDTLSPALSKAGAPILNEADSATALARGAFAAFARSHPGYALRIAALNPLSPDNLADAEETRIIDDFRAAAVPREASGTRFRQGREEMYVGRPVVVERSCLRCHGNPDDAPPEMLQKYPGPSGFGWVPGEVQGASILSFPLEEVREAQAAAGRTTLLAFGGAALIASGALALMFDWLVYRRLKPLTASMSQLAANPASPRHLEAQGGDELADTARAFNSMADTVSEALAAHKARAGERATMLLQANAALADEAQARRLAEEDARQARLAAEAASRAKSDLLANVSHELRTPLHGILGLADLTLETSLTDEQREYLSMLKSSGQALAGIVNDLLDFSRLEAGKLQLDSNPFDLRDLACEVLRGLAPRAHARGVEVTFEAAADVPVLALGDAARLRQALGNLVGNAVKFTERGEVAVKALTAPGGQVRFEVRDTGPGIPADWLARIFEPFERADSSTTRKAGGVGLGLAITAHLARLMGGEVGVDSELGRGSTFWLTARLDRAASSSPPPAPLPAGKRILLLGEGPTMAVTARLLASWGVEPVRALPADAVLTDGEKHPLPDGLPALALVPSHQSSALPAHVRRITRPAREAELRDAVSRMLSGSGQDAASVRSLRVLVAEDGMINQRLIERLLGRRGHTVRVVADGAAAVAAASAETFDLALMDVQMPVMDGLEATRRIRELEARRGVARLPVLALTASVLEEDRRRCSEAGMDAFLPKPLRLEHLEEALSAVAEGRPLGGG
jgi:signal transduction histidine kinase/ActR/RegA family two-component response regulator